MLYSSPCSLWFIFFYHSEHKEYTKNTVHNRVTIKIFYMKRFCLALDLMDDPEKIRAYEAYHREVWPEIIESIRASGIGTLDIYRTGNRLFMILEAADDFSFEKKAEMDRANPRVQEWEDLMWNYQQALPGTKPGEKWILMDKIFSLP